MNSLRGAQIIWNIEMEALFELADLSGKRHRIGGFANKHLDGNGAAFRSAEQTGP